METSRRAFFGSALAAGAAGAMRGEPQSPAAPKGDFHLGSVTYNLLKDYDLDTIIRTLETVGYEAVELRTEHKHGVEPSIDAAERARVRRRFESSKVRLLSYGTTCRFQSPDPAERARQLEVAKSFVDLAHDTGALAIKLQPMGLPPNVPQENAIQYFGASMRQLGEYGAGKRIEIWMEVHGNGTQNPPVAAALLRAAGHDNVGACWNSNPTDVQNGSVKESFALLRPWIRNVHLHELTDDQYPFRELFALLRESGYNRYTLAEVAESKETERYMRMFKALWTEMKRPSCA
jgi:sugar phosphate isomerase/epimerase